MSTKKKSGGVPGWLIAVVVIALAGLGYWLLNYKPAQSQTLAPAPMDAVPVTSQTAH